MDIVLMLGAIGTGVVGIVRPRTAARYQYWWRSLGWRTRDTPSEREESISNLEPYMRPIGVAMVLVGSAILFAIVTLR
jgi:hypothetical protein